MKDLFDRAIDKVLRGDQKKRIRQVTMSAAVLLVLCLAGLGFLAFYPLEYKVIGTGFISQVGPQGQVIIEAEAENRFFPLVEPGQPARVKGLPLVPFKVEEKGKDEEEGMILKIVGEVSPKDQPKIMALAKEKKLGIDIIFKRESLLKTMMRRD